MPGKVYLLPGEVNERRKGGVSWLHQVILDRKEIGWPQALLEANAKANALTDDGTSPLLLAASLGDAQLVALLLRHGADKNCAAYKGYTAVRNAAGRGHVEVVKLLVDQGADPFIAGEDGLSAVQAAAENGHDNIVAILKDIAEPPERSSARRLHDQAVASMDNRDFRAALPLLTEAANLMATINAPVPVNYQNIAVCHAELGEFREALTVLEDAIRRWPHDARLRSNHEAIRRDADAKQRQNEREERDERQRKERERIANIQELRRAKAECILCGGPLGSLDKLFGRAQHKRCRNFS